MKLIFRLLQPFYIKSLFTSVQHYFKFFNRKRSIDILFYAPVYFNRNNSHLFNTLFKTCDEKNISYLFVEEVDYAKKCDFNLKGKRADFFVLLVVLARKMIKSNEIIKKDRLIGKYLRLYCGIKPKNIIVLSQSMVGVFRGMFPNAKIFDLQHGIIHSNHEAYKTETTYLIKNKVLPIVYGLGFKEILENINIHYSNTIVLGNSDVSPVKKHSKFNGNILLSLQFTDDHSKEENKTLYLNIVNVLRQIEALKNSSIQVYYKNHPRFKEEVNLSFVKDFDFVQKAPNNLAECFDLCSVNITAYSTVVFDAALHGVPTIFYSKKHTVFKDEYNYPIEAEVKDLVNLNYDETSSKVMFWYKQYYQEYNYSNFLNILK